MQLYKFPLLAALLLFVACKQDPKSTSSSVASPTANTAVASDSKPEVILYSVGVDNLLLRDLPTQKGSKVITKFTQNEFVTGTGAHSANQEEAEIRGIPMRDYFFKVTSTRPAKETGWVFGSAIVSIYAGSNEGIPDINQLSQLKNFLNSLNPKDLKSGKKAWDFVNTSSVAAKGAYADAVYVLFTQFMKRMEVEGEFYKMVEKIEWSQADFDAIYKDNFDMNKLPLTKSLAENGLRLETAEGSVFPITDWQKLYAFFGNKVSPAMKSYLDQDMIEQKDSDSEDGGLVISVDELAKRAIFWEEFNQKNPYFTMSEITKLNENWMRDELLLGLNNTPTYDSETKKVNDEFKKAWMDVLQKYPSTKLAAKVKELTDLYASSNWKYNDKVAEWTTKLQEIQN